MTTTTRGFKPFKSFVKKTDSMFFKAKIGGTLVIQIKVDFNGTIWHVYSTQFESGNILLPHFNLLHHKLQYDLTPIH